MSTFIIWKIYYSIYVRGNVHLPLLLKFSTIVRLLLNLLDYHSIDMITERNTITIYTSFIPGNPQGEENPAKLLQYRFNNQVQLQNNSLSTRDKPP